MKIERFEDIEAWQICRRLAQEIFKVSFVGAFGRDFGLRDQINRSAGSSMDNIAEGFDGGSNAEFIRFLGYAQRSCSEVKSQLYRALDRSYIDNEQFEHLFEMADEAQAKIGGFIRYLKNSKRS
jgi:four helix bundle protein